jgi:hypothetical protein
MVSPPCTPTALVLLQTCLHFLEMPDPTQSLKQHKGVLPEDSIGYTITRFFCLLHHLRQTLSFSAQFKQSESTRSTLFSALWFQGPSPDVKEEYVHVWGRICTYYLHAYFLMFSSAHVSNCGVHLKQGCRLTAFLFQHMNPVARYVCHYLFVKYKMKSESIQQILKLLDEIFAAAHGQDMTSLVDILLFEWKQIMNRTYISTLDSITHSGWTNSLPSRTDLARYHATASLLRPSVTSFSLAGTDSIDED